jgi:uncharacterized protein YggE
MATGTLTDKQEKAVAALLTEPTISAAAAKAGIGERTLHRWLEEPAFDQAYRNARRKAVQRAIGRLQQVSTAAVAVLVRVMANEEAPSGTRVAAARTVLEFAIRAVELEDHEERLAELERRLGVAR